MTKRTDVNQTWDADGNLISEESVEVDISREVQRATAQSWLATLSMWAQQETAGDDPEEVVLAVRLTVEATAVLLAD